MKTFLQLWYACNNLIIIKLWWLSCRFDGFSSRPIFVCHIAQQAWWHSASRVCNNLFANNIFPFPCKCFPWICLEMPRKVWLFCTSLMLLMMYALLVAEKDWWPQIAQWNHLFKHICTYTFIQKDPLPLEEASTAKNICIFITNCRKEHRGYSASNRILILY